MPDQDHASKMDALEKAACDAVRPHASGFNPNASIPHGVTVGHIAAAMGEFTDFLGFINAQLRTRQIVRLETMLMPANFSSVVGEFMISTIPKHCPTIAKNTYHNGHPDLVPAGLHARNSVQHGTEGIEVKASRYLKAWQGHNAEDAWLMVFCYESGRPNDEDKGVKPKPFRFLLVLGAQLIKADWLFAGRSDTSRRTITASVIRTGYDKMMDNWIYKDPGLRPSTIEAMLESEVRLFAP